MRKTKWSSCAVSITALQKKPRAGEYALVIGVAIGLVGMIMVALAYPVYNRVLKKERERIAPQILRLTDELMK